MPSYEINQRMLLNPSNDKWFNTYDGLQMTMNR